MKGKLLIFCMVLLLFGACKNNDVYFQYHEVDTVGWNKDSVYLFDVEITDTVSPYNLYINVRHNPDYPYQNLWLFLSESTPDSVLSKDTIEFYLANQRGEWLGTGASDLKEMPVLYKQNYFFEKSGIYQFGIVHGMRTDSLAGIVNIGLRVEKTEIP